MQLQVIRANIIRVLASPQKAFATEESLITAFSKEAIKKWNLATTGDKITLKTSALTAVVLRKTGTVSFYDAAGKRLLSYKSMLYYNKLRYRLLPYIYSLAGATYHNNGTIMRGLVMDFPKDTAVYNIGDQYLFGPSLLINPVYNYQQRNRELYLPKGAGWYDLYTGKYTSGGQRLNADAPYERMPVFVREGSIIPFGPDLQYTAEKPADTITLYVYGGKDGTFNLYEDEGINYNYEKGAFATILVTYNEQTKMLIIGNRKGNFPGMLQTRIFRIVGLSHEKRKPLDGALWDKEIVYEGKSVSIKM